MLKITGRSSIMPRPKSCRRVCAQPGHTVFKPAGVPACELGSVVLEMDEFEAIRLADLEGVYQEQAARQMNVSRQTFGRIIENARRKIAKALVEGMAIRIEGGIVERGDQRSFKCGNCGNAWNEPFGTGRPAGCPACGSGEFFRSGCAAAEQKPRPDSSG